MKSYPNMHQFHLLLTASGFCFLFFFSFDVFFPPGCCFVGFFLSYIKMDEKVPRLLRPRPQVARVTAKKCFKRKQRQKRWQQGHMQRYKHVNKMQRTVPEGQHSSAKAAFSGHWACPPPTKLGPKAPRANSGLSLCFLVTKHSYFNRAHGSFLEHATQRSLRKVSKFSTSTFACQSGPKSRLILNKTPPVKLNDFETNHGHGAS